MARGFTVQETIVRPVDQGWVFVTYLGCVDEWMNGVSQLNPVSNGPIGQGSRFRFDTRGREHETTITAWQPMKKFAMASMQGGVTATYAYSVANAGEDRTSSCTPSASQPTYGRSFSR